MKKIHIFSPEKDRKIAWMVSIIFMSAAWLAFAAILVWAVLEGWAGDGDDPIVPALGGLVITSLVLIPIQLFRYFRRK
jgi:hypothetical protein